MNQINFTDKHGSFTLEKPENTNYLYFPLASETGLKSSLSPDLGGDAKINQETFLLEPVSSENLHNNRSTRNFWIKEKNGNTFSITGASALQEAYRFTANQENSRVNAGFMWHTLERECADSTLKTSITSFIPISDNVEIMYITIENASNQDKVFTPYAAIPLYGRSADNIRDHRNVTSMLHRIRVTEDGVQVCPTMSFDERGHRPNQQIYYVYGFGNEGQKPEEFYPVVEDFIGEGGTFTHPRAIYENHRGVQVGATAQGKEAMGAFRFPEITLNAGKSASYALFLGAEDQEEKITALFEHYHSADKVKASLENVKTYWQEKVNVAFTTKDASFDSFMKWVCFQPFLRRLFGCSFLPHHDYGRGGRGWRDLWQDCLSLLLMEPGDVGQMIEKNFGGVRLDGTNATIIGDGIGNFIADRNGIARVWMDHALWPQMTTKLYIDQTGDVDILNRPASYFKDSQAARGTSIDSEWAPEQGNIQLTTSGETYSGSILEHLLIQQLSAFYEVGEHNIYRLRGADWNDALDMASERGESVAFTCAYAGNLLELAQMIRLLEKNTPDGQVKLLSSLTILLEDNVQVFESIVMKHQVLKAYLKECSNQISGTQITLFLSDLADNLEKKANWLMEHLRKQEWLDEGEEGWFNSYYDNHGRTVEGIFPEGVRMMLTGQVFATMGKVASDEQIEKIVKSADHYLYKKEIGGYRLNTDFHELKSDMGRMFGFAYGEKENGAVFSHMTVMFANALYQRGFAKEGWKALKSLSDVALDFNTSHIYPGIPEYFRADGRGMYHYLTGAASWYMMTMITQVFGVRGEAGDLIFDPKLTGEQFDNNHEAKISLTFAEKKFEVIYKNPSEKDYEEYAIDSVRCNGTSLTKNSLTRSQITELTEETNQIIITLV